MDCSVSFPEKEFSQMSLEERLEECGVHPEKAEKLLLSVDECAKQFGIVLEDYTFPDTGLKTVKKVVFVFVGALVGLVALVGILAGAALFAIGLSVAYPLSETVRETVRQFAEVHNPGWYGLIHEFSEKLPF